jgi:signal transduction histidine kinase
MLPAAAGALVVAGITGYLALHHAAIWVARRPEPLHLWTASWCAVSLAVALGRFLHYTATDASGAALGMRIALGSSFLLISLLVGLCGTLTRQPLTPRVSALFAALNATIAALTFATDWMVLDRARPFEDLLGQRYLWVELGPGVAGVLPYASAVYAYWLLRILRAEPLRGVARSILAVSFGIYFLCGANDLLLGAGLLHTASFFEYSPVILALGFDAIALQRFHRLNERLEDEVELRTRQVRDSLHAAEQGARAKSAFLANMSHEIRTPMNGVLGTLQLLLAELAPGSARRLADTAYQSAATLLRLLDDVLDLAKIESGRLTTERVPTDLRALVREVVELHRPAARAKPLELVCELDPALPALVQSDPLRLRQVLSNLVSNAIKFTEAGRVRVAARVNEVHAADLRIGFEIEDTGIGITPGQMQRLFQPFAQADASTTRRFGGTGLGLAISRQLVQMLDGELQVESKPDHGSCFRFAIRAERAQTEAVVRETPPLAPAEAAPACEARTAPRVLLAEDNEVNELVACRMLEKLGCSVRVARSGAEAVELAFEELFDLVLMDCQMPGMDGFEATRAIRERERSLGRAPARIVALTAHAMAGDRDRCLAAGMDDHFAKPFRFEELRERIAHWLQPAR